MYKDHLTLKIVIHHKKIKRLLEKKGISVGEDYDYNVSVETKPITNVFIKGRKNKIRDTGT